MLLAHIKTDAVQPESPFFHAFFFPVKTCIVHYPQCNSTPKFGSRFRCVKLVVANVAWNLWPVAEMRSSFLSNSTPTDMFYIKRLVFSPNQCWFKRRHLRTFIRPHTASTGDTKGFIQVRHICSLLPNTWKHTFPFTTSMLSSLLCFRHQHISQAGKKSLDLEALLDS